MSSLHPGSAVCGAIKRDGTPCTNKPTSSGRCFAHDEGLRAKTAEARRQGGHNSSSMARAKKRIPAELATIVQLVESTMAKVYSGALTPQQGSAIASLSGAWVKLHELGELAAEVRELRALVEGRKWPA